MSVHKYCTSNVEARQSSDCRDMQCRGSYICGVPAGLPSAHLQTYSTGPINEEECLNKTLIRYRRDTILIWIKRRV